METGIEAVIYIMALAIVVLTLHTRRGTLVPLAYLWGVDAALILLTLKKILFDQGRDVSHILVALAFTCFAAYISHKRARQHQTDITQPDADPLDAHGVDAR